ncbi:LOW QUALITY PROTEIN: DUF659 domain-containing protein, partial [Cephalotus follicularis]
VTCNFCGQTKKGGICHMKQHFIGGYRNTSVCKKCPEHVKEEIREYMKRKKEVKKHTNILPALDDFENGDDDEEDIEEIDLQGKKKLRPQSGGGGSSAGKAMMAKKPARHIGPLDTYFIPNPEEVVKNRKGIKQKTIIAAYKHDAHKQELRETKSRQIARWMYAIKISFNDVKHDSFHAMIETMGLFGQGMKPPSYHEMRVTLLKKKLEHKKKLMDDHKEDWAKYGCSIMSNGWTDKKQRTLINFLVNCPRRTMFEMLDNFVQRIKPKNVVQVVTNRRLLESKYQHLYWTPYAAHCMHLMLEDIGKLNNNMRTLRRAITLNSYIYTRSGVLNMTRQFTGQRELLSLAKTRFATAFLTLASIHSRMNIRKMFTSKEWTKGKWAKEVLGKKVASIILMPCFWTSIMHCLKVASPLVYVLRLIDGKKRNMGFIYEAMDKAKEASKKALSGNEEKYKEVFTIIDQRLEVQLHRPSHAARYFLN